jgi:Skp family chaperone for outer membrane proteins
LRCAFACGAVFLFAAALRPAHAEDANRRIAVVNVARVFNSYQKVGDIQKRLEKLFDPEYNALKKEAEDLQKRKTQIEMDPRAKNNVEFFQDVQKFEMDKLKHEIRFQNLAKDVEEKRKNDMRAVLNDIKTAIRVVGSAEKYDLVLRAPEFEDEFDPTRAEVKDKENKDRNEPQSAAELVRKFRENPVLFFSTGVDITQKVVDKLNTDYKAAAPADK